MSMAYLYQRDPRPRGMFYTNRVYLEQLHSRRDSLVGDPEKASLYFIPVMLTQMSNSLWEAYDFLQEAVQWVRSRFPFWNRTDGSDHYIFSGQDLGGCWVPEILRSSIIVSHFGFRAAESVWGDLRRWELAKITCEAWIPGYDHVHWHPACFQRKKDIVVPIDVSIPNEEHIRQVRDLETECRTPAALKRRRALLYVSGAMSSRYNDV